MSTSADDLAAGLKASVAINKLQTSLTEESFLLLKALVGDFIRTEVAAAIRETQAAARRKRARSTRQSAQQKGPRI